MILQIAAYVVVTLVWTFYKFRFFLNEKQPKMAVIHSCLMGLCMILGSLLFAHVQLPSTTIPVRIIFEPIGKFILQQ